MYYPQSENKGADQLRGYREADLRLFFAYADCWFSHGAAHTFSCKNLKFSAEKNVDIFLFSFFAQNTDCGYSLKPFHRGGSNVRRF